MDALTDRRQRRPATEGPLLPWAVFNKLNAVCFVDLARNEDDVWRVYTGWGSDDDIAHLKAKGMRAVRVDVIERKP